MVTLYAGPWYKASWEYNRTLAIALILSPSREVQRQCTGEADRPALSKKFARTHPDSSPLTYRA